MRTFQADDVLEHILKLNGLIEIPNKSDSIKENRSFRRSKKSSKEIYFDGENICVANGTQQSDRKSVLTMNELKMLLLYFNISQNDSREVFPKGKFDFKIAESYFDSLEKELNSIKDLNSNRVRRKKIKRIIQRSNSIVLN